MSVFDDHHHKLNQTFLRFLGLWPYKKSKFEYFRAICIYILLISYVILQLAQFAIVDLNMDVIITILGNAFPAMICAVKFSAFFFDTKTIKQMMERIINYQRMLIDVQEIKIAEHYARQGKHILIVFILLATFCIFSFLVFELLPEALDFVWPQNKSRVRYLESMNILYENQEIPFYPLLLYVTVNITTGSLSVASIGAMLLSIVLHSCALFKISSYHIEHTVVTSGPNRSNIMTERIIKSVEFHRNARKLIELLLSGYSITFLCLILLGVSSISMSLFRILRAIMYTKNLIEFVAALLIFILGQFYLFLANYCGQMILDHANRVFNAIYKSLWYLAPVKVQKLLLFMMQISAKGFKPTAGGLFISSMEGFTTLSSMSMSYFTVIYSTQ